MDSDRQSILSHGEREIATLLREGQSVEEIAAARDEPTAAIEKATDRIEAKTDRAVATLLESPFSEDAVSRLTDDEQAILESLVAER